MKNLFKKTSLALALAVAPALALADTAETKGGLKIKTDDGRFEMAIGGRIHYDGYVFEEDDGSAFGSTSLLSQGGFAFRRTYLTLTGKAYGWKYKFENDFAAMGGTAGAQTITCTAVDVDANNDGVVDAPAANIGNVATTCTAASSSVSNVGSSGFRELWVSTNLGPGEIILGQFKPFRGMEELTSSNEITMIERPWTSATGVYNGRQFLMGAGYKGNLADSLLYSAHLMSLGAANTTTEGYSYGSRLAFYPMSGDGSTVHLGLSYSKDKEQNQGGTSASISAAAPYAGRRGPSLSLGSVGNTTDAAQTTMAAEAAVAFGPMTLQAEYAQSELENSIGTMESDVIAYYFQASFFLTGETTTYKKDRGAFGKPKPLGEYGAWELTARYDFAENKDESAANNVCSISGGTATGGGNGGELKCEATTITAGINWYVNPNVRFMLNYYMGEADVGVGPADKPKAATLRTQFSF